MPATLDRIDFEESDLDTVAIRDFHCGDSPWEREAADFIKQRTQVLDAMRRGTKIWLYVQTEAPGLVGFGTLGPSRWRWPDSHSPRQHINIIPWVAVQTPFQGMGFGRQILQNLIGEARLCADRLPVLGFTSTVKTRMPNACTPQ